MHCICFLIKRAGRRTRIDLLMHARVPAIAASITLSSLLSLGSRMHVLFKFMYRLVLRWSHTLRFVSEFLCLVLPICQCSTSWTAFIWASLVSNSVFQSNPFGFKLFADWFILNNFGSGRRCNYIAVSEKSRSANLCKQVPICLYQSISSQVVDEH